MQRRRSHLSAVAEVQGRKRRCHVCRSAFRLNDLRWPDRACRVDRYLLADPLRFSGFGHSGGGAAFCDFGDQLAEPRREDNILFFYLRRRTCDLASPVKSFAAYARHGTALYSKVKLTKTAIIGAGGWGTALACLWAHNGQNVLLWGHNSDRIACMGKTRENSDYLPGVEIPRSVCVTSELGDCAGADPIVFVTPSMALRNIGTQLRRIIGDTHAVLLSCTKGIEHRSGMRMSEVLSELFPHNVIAVLSGPNLATEVANRLPAATVIGCHDGAWAASLQRLLGRPRFRIYTSQDVASIELGGALKNVFA